MCVNIGPVMSDKCIAHKIQVTCLKSPSPEGRAFKPGRFMQVCRINSFPTLLQCTSTTIRERLLQPSRNIWSIHGEIAEIQVPCRRNKVTVGQSKVLQSFLLPNYFPLTKCWEVDCAPYIYLSEVERQNESQNFSLQTWAQIAIASLIMSMIESLQLSSTVK